MTAKIAAALHEVMQKCSYVQKNGHNKFHNYRYAGEADLLAVLRPAMVEAGLLLIPSITQATGPDEYGNTTVRIEYTLAHKGGDIWPEKVVAMGCGNDKNSKGGIGDKGLYKAITGANKYALFKLFQIETGDEPEADERDHEPPTRTQAAANRSPSKSEPAQPPANNAAKVITLDAGDDNTETFPATKGGAVKFLDRLEDLVMTDYWYWKANEATANRIGQAMPDLGARIEHIATCNVRAAG